MSTFTVDAYKGWPKDKLKQRCRELVRIVGRRDAMLCAVVQFGSLDQVPEPLQREIRKICAALD